MHLRKLAWAMPLMLAATAAHADGSGSFLEGAKLAALARPEAAAPANSPSHRPPAAPRNASQGQAPATSTTALPTSSAVLDADAEVAGASFEIRNFLTLVVALALVGWIQRRRRDA
ncbi:hypothetical protein [Mitsuaria sp. GD03876]|uniref:hypothetical protein n=1 Tax=Mitsuaria sp. GD03876 TaxID=2975399 RepID=UPI00244D0AAB|nr:hypothetical protein [Mitsuaria sp. GD03876]MDH0866077.1 hypothetical protein [Mitsuaria sp. GD03876]